MFSSCDRWLHRIKPYFGLVVPGGVVVDGKFFTRFYVAYCLYEHRIGIIVHKVFAIGAVGVVEQRYKAQCHATHVLTIGLPLENVVFQLCLVYKDAVFGVHHYYWCRLNYYPFFDRFFGENTSAFVVRVANVELWVGHWEQLGCKNAHLQENSVLFAPFLYFYNPKGTLIMNLFKKPVNMLAFALLLLATEGSAQYRFKVEPFFNYFKDPRRYSIGGTYIMPTAEFNGVTPVYDQNTYRGDSAAKRPQTGTGMGGFIGISVPIKATGHISCWAVSLQLMGNMYTWSDINKRMALDGTLTAAPTPLNGSTMQIAMPIGIDYNIGCDAILTKRLAMGTSLGAGFMPQYNITSLTGVDGIDPYSSFGFTPYLKGEFAAFIGVCVKFRVMYSMGSVKLIDVPRSFDNLTDGPFRVSSQSNLMLSFIIMPFSMKWKEYDWYNTYDTYNQYDRLN